MPCPLGCADHLCSAQCYLEHRRTCAHSVLDKLKVLVISQEKEETLVSDFVVHGISVDVEKPGRRRTPDAALLLVITRVGWALSRQEWKGTLKQLDALKVQRIEGRLAILLDKSSARTWYLKEVKEMKESLDIDQARFKISKGKSHVRFQILHNLPAHCFAQMRTSPVPRFGHSAIVPSCLGSKAGQALCPCIKAGLAEWGSKQYPVGKVEQQASVLACLKHSTRGFSNTCCI